MNGRILIVDDVATNRILYRARLAAALYEPLLAVDGASCLSLAAEEKPDLILLDLTLPDMMGIEVLKRLRSLPQTQDIPIIALTSATDAEARLPAFSAGADDVLVKPASDAVLLARVRNLLRSRGDADLSAAQQMPAMGFAEPKTTFERGGTIAMLASLPDANLDWRRELQGQSRDKVVIVSRSQALAEAGSSEGSFADVPDVFIIGNGKGDTLGGLRLLSELKSHPSTRHSAVCVVGQSGDDETAAMAFDLGADDVVNSAISGHELSLRVRSLMRRKRRGDRQRASVHDSLRLAMIDPLTGLHNRRYAMPRLAAIAAQSHAESTDFAVMVVDLDKFKAVNDHFGHAAGDQVLVEVANRLTNALRITDLLARIGGEEFLVVLPNTAMAQARQVAERLCEAVQEMPVRLPSGQALTITVSIGVAVSSRASGIDQHVESLVEQADLALLDSKSSGRNQVTFRLTAA
ncbi:diguanylate cyclase [Tabrizicola sp.]|uniref:diguanylate cyclase n=1 Tax=Tabrizicola sp. TaxID=2005166 RepID=UPI00286CE9DA|nr:diguanylate cyclase [Tabrizicola sp.]